METGKHIRIFVTGDDGQEHEIPAVDLFSMGIEFTPSQEEVDLVSSIETQEYTISSSGFFDFNLKKIIQDYFEQIFGLN